ncbi:thioredoxin [Pectobacterium phage POP12]|nr:thioredoxin [Pectobacterium phage POP12]
MNKIVHMVFGSHMYGLATETSDKDYKGIYLPEPRDILLGNVKSAISFSSGNSGSKNTVNDTDVDFYSLHKFIKLACDGDTMAIDMLHCPNNMLVNSSPEWDFIVKNRHRFYTTELTGLFGYVRKQAAKYGVKGSRMAALRQVLDKIYSLNVENPYKFEKVGQITQYLPRNEFCVMAFQESESCGNQIFYEVLGRKYQTTIDIKEMESSLLKIWNEYGARARQAEQNQGIDWKALSHAVRGGYQLISIFELGTIEYPLEHTETILKVKKGELPFKDVQEILETTMQKVEKLAAVSDYPKQVDREFWENFVENVYQSHCLRYYK